MSAVVPTLFAQRLFRPREELGEAGLVGPSGASAHIASEEREVAGALDE